MNGLNIRRKEAAVGFACSGTRVQGQAQRQRASARLPGSAVVPPARLARRGL